MNRRGRVVWILVPALAVAASVWAISAQAGGAPALWGLSGGAGPLSQRGGNLEGLGSPGYAHLCRRGTHAGSRPAEAGGGDIG